MKLQRKSVISERMGYIQGSFEELQTEVLHNVDFKREHQKFQAQVKLVEATIKTIREYIYTQFADTDENERFQG